MHPWLKHILGGLVCTAFGAGFALWAWYTALHEGVYYPKMAMVGPAFLVLGLAILVTPPGTITEEGPDKRRLTPFGWLVTLAAIGAGALQWGVFHFGWFLR